MANENLVCCGKKMGLDIEMPLHYEFRCAECGDTIYVKKEKPSKPQMIDD